MKISTSAWLTNYCSSIYLNYTNSIYNLAYNTKDKKDSTQEYCR